MLVVLGKLNVLGCGPLDITIPADSITSIVISEPYAERLSWTMEIQSSVEEHKSVVALFESEQETIEARNRIVSSVNTALASSR